MVPDHVGGALERCGAFEVRRARIDEILPVRAAVLRPGRPISSARFEGDELETTMHAAAVIRRTDGKEHIVGAGTLLSWDEEGFQVRGMAVLAETQGKGVGSKILEFLISEAMSRANDAVIWLNARASAVPFYLRHGFLVNGEMFEIPGIGPHYRMVYQKC
jgi:predicted GNAT family N-acyltransferase